MSVILHVFPSSEDHYDAVCGCDSLYFASFPSRESAWLWFTQEFADSGWYYQFDDELQRERIQLAAA